MVKQSEGDKMKERKDRQFNDQLARALNKRFGFPEDYKGPIGGFENVVPLAMAVFGSDSIEEITKEE